MVLQRLCKRTHLAHHIFRNSLFHSQTSLCTLYFDISICVYIAYFSTLPLLLLSTNSLSLFKRFAIVINNVTHLHKIEIVAHVHNLSSTKRVCHTLHSSFGLHRALFMLLPAYLVDCWVVVVFFFVHFFCSLQPNN